MLQNVLSDYGFAENITTVKPFGNGLINNTWHVTTNNHAYILQRINNHVFKSPEDIAINIKMLAAYLKENNSTYLLIAPVATIHNGALQGNAEDGYYRLFPFVKGSHTIDVVDNADQASEAAGQFGKFTKAFSRFDPASLKITLPDFHNLALRYRQFLQSLQSGNKKRIKESAETISFLQAHAGIVDVYEKIKAEKEFKLRVTHHDTKISNILFDDNNKGICVIDLDTVMPGYFISDVGDMLRTYLSPVSEEEKRTEEIEIRRDVFEAVAGGYINEMKGELSKTEIKHFVYAGKFMIYMQALRFATDHINNDIYYGSKYKGHNLVRARNQVQLLKSFLKDAGLLEEIIRKL